MNNTQSHFAINPVNIDIQRSIFKRPSKHLTTFDSGKLIPIFVDEVLPGDTFKMDVSQVVRMTTPIYPTMDNAFLDVEFFFVPNRLVWEHWKEFMGENNSTYWAQPTEYQIPEIINRTGFGENTIANYMGVPTKKQQTTINSLPIKAYCLIWNEFWRDQNVMTPVYINKGDYTLETTEETDYITEAQKGNIEPLPVSKFHDYFTSALPAPQKGQPVEIGLAGNAPVMGKISESATILPILAETGDGIASIPMGLGTLDTNAITTGGSLRGAFNADTLENDGTFDTRLYANLGATSAININDIRTAFQIQRLLEKDARGGTRYIELLKAHFGVTSSDARMQRPEYLGGKQIPLTMQQVAQTSGTTETSPQGNVSALSHTSDYDQYFTKSFEEHGFVIGVCCVRTDQTYQQGLEKMWSRKRRFDFYWPALANLGEMPILNKEIYYQGNGRPEDDQVFGYQEAWAEYRYKPNRVSGAMRSNYDGTLDTWHYANSFSSLPTLSKEFIQETSANIQRTLAVQDEPQFIADFYFDLECTRAMPMYSIPGLIDHH